MITREQIQELAQFEDASGCALSFYFQPTAPRSKAHKEDAILTKELAREALHRLEGGKLESGSPENREKEKCPAAREDLDRIVRLSQEWRGNGIHAKAVFACATQSFWREFDLPAQLSATQLQVGRHFRLKPLAQLLGAFPALGIVLLDRHRARLFDLRLGELTEREGFFQPTPRRGRSDGLTGYDGGHAERRADEEARQHFKSVAEHLKAAVEKHGFEKWILGCQESHWPQFESQLPSAVAQQLLGRFASDMAHVNRDVVRARAEEIFSAWRNQRCAEAVQQAISQARSNARGVTGLRRTLRALEMREVQTLLVGDRYIAQAVECTGCGHLDAHLVNFCPVCGRETREVVDVAEAILPRVISQDVEVFYVKDNPDLDAVGNIAALLRYRSGNNVHPIDENGDKSSLGRQSGLVGRYRGFAAS
jgi:hypothetical protein